MFCARIRVRVCVCVCVSSLMVEFLASLCSFARPGQICSRSQSRYALARPTENWPAKGAKTKPGKVYNGTRGPSFYCSSHFYCWPMFSSLGQQMRAAPNLRAELAHGLGQVAPRRPLNRLGPSLSSAALLARSRHLGRLIGAPHLAGARIQPRRTLQPTDRLCVQWAQ